MLTRLSLRLRIFLIFAGLAGAIVVATTLGLWLGYSRLGEPGALQGFVQAGVLAGFAALGLVAWVWYLFDLHVAKPIETLAGALRARAHSDVTAEMDAAIARYLGDLAPAAQAAAQSLAETRSALAEAVARETLRLGSEKARLEALLSDVPVGVILCSADHALVFYNGPAADIIGTGRAGGLEAGLDRKLFDYIHAAPLRHAHERLMATGDPDAVSDLLCTTTAGARVLAARMRLLGEGGDGGYVLTLRDITADMAADARREAMLEGALDSLRRPAAALSTIVGVMPEDALPAPMQAALREEVARLAQAVTRFGAAREEGQAEAAALPQTRASDLAEGLVARLAAQGLIVTVETADLILRCNGYEIITVLEHLARHLADRAVGRLHLSIEEEDSGATIRLSWTGPRIGVGELDSWLALPLSEETAERPARAVLSAHATEIWPETAADGRHALCLPIRQARRAVARPKPVVRKVIYDFDLLSPARTDALADRRLDRLTYVVFDSETTGLNPRQGDEIVQLAAVRIVNGRRVEGEVFDTLVNPGRPIPAVSTAVHGITDAMVADAPRVEDVVRRFHKFAEGAVLIAHNAPFDMEFLRRQEGTLGLRFDMPVLDTVLLSAVVYGQHEVHSLDALAHRLGIAIPEEARHTALGDTIATADAFLKLLPMLAGRGLATFGAVLTEVRKHGRLLKDLN
ncbi:exonuclease domain-containing protein [Tabrizicola sp. YIM 78059]|uniref:exonuclease domain-containing protein n=1 Tax=Tabrizicola sp. YIM 78059 TaxID=2529861 RepID=UPI0010AB2D7B|nr:exonuclease domain-containing protein [Tabrizicola sp. YIM 78059]